jgi:hypothetical protein
MPDRDFLTVSASEVAALYNQSPYMSRWMLYQKFKKGPTSNMGSNSGGDLGFDRMAWGNRSEQMIIEAVSEKLKIPVTSNSEYRRHKTYKLGATVDAVLHCPEQGPGALEVKNVDGWIFRNEWTDYAPRHIELQHQCQMLVGNGERPYTWGVIAALAGGNELKIYAREPDEAVQRDMVKEAQAFFLELENNIPPDPSGLAKEIPVLSELYADSFQPGANIYTEDKRIKKAVAYYMQASKEESQAKKDRSEARNTLLKFAAEHGVETVYTPDHEITVSRTDTKAHHRPASTRTQVKVKPRR